MYTYILKRPLKFHKVHQLSSLYMFSLSTQSSLHTVCIFSFSFSIFYLFIFSIHLLIYFCIYICAFLFSIYLFLRFYLYVFFFFYGVSVCWYTYVNEYISVSKCSWVYELVSFMRIIWQTALWKRQRNDVITLIYEKYA